MNTSSETLEQLTDYVRELPLTFRAFSETPFGWEMDSEKASAGTSSYSTISVLLIC